MNRARALTLVRAGSALLVIAAIVVQAIVLAQAGRFDATRFFAFFTIQSNLIGVAAFAWLVANRDRPRSRALELLRGAAAVYLTVTFVVVILLLSDVDVQLQVNWAEFTLHKLFPVVVVIDWLVDPPLVRLTLRDALVWLVYPIAWTAVTLVRGAVDGWYPYPFLDPANGGWASVAVTIVAITAGFLLLSAAMVTLGEWRAGSEQTTIDSMTGDTMATRIVDLSHPIEAGMVTYPGLPVPEIHAVLDRATSAGRYAPGVTFQIDLITLCGNTGTYMDSPFHRWEDGADLAGLPLGAPGRPAGRPHRRHRERHRRGRRRGAPWPRARRPGGPRPHRVRPVLANRRLPARQPVPDPRRRRAPGGGGRRARRHRLAQHRLHRRPRATRPFPPAAGRDPDRRAHDEPWRGARSTGRGSRRSRRPCAGPARSRSARSPWCREAPARATNVGRRRYRWRL